MAEAICSAVAGEAVIRLTSQLVSNHDEKASKRHNLVKLETLYYDTGYILQKSSMYAISNEYLLLQRKNLERKHEELGNELRRHEQQALKDEENAKLVMSSSFPTRLVHSMKSKVSSLRSNGEDEFSATVREYEWFAAYCRKFLSDVEIGAALWQPKYRFSMKSLPYQFNYAIETVMQDYIDLPAQDVNRKNFTPMIEQFSDKIADYHAPPGCHDHSCGDPALCSWTRTPCTRRTTIFGTLVESTLFCHLNPRRSPCTRLGPEVLYLLGF